MAADDVRALAGESHALADSGAIAVVALLLAVFLAPYAVWLRLGSATIPPHFELRVLLVCVLLAVILPLTQIGLQIRRFGGAAIRSNRVDFPVDDGMGGRVARAHRNLIESLLPFAVAVFALEMVGASSRTTVAAAGLYVAARLVHAATYMLGVTVLRSAAFYAGVIATTILVFQLPILA